MVTSTDTVQHAGPLRIFDPHRPGATAFNVLAGIFGIAPAIVVLVALFL